VRTRHEEIEVRRHYDENWDTEEDKQRLATTKPTVFNSKPKKKVPNIRGFSLLIQYC
jgi:hypothetical protein